MARRCTVCIHPDRQAIDQMMVNLRPYRSIMDRFTLSKGSLIRHHDDHLPKTLARAKAAQETAQADDLLGQVKALRNKSMSLLLAAEKSGDLRTALAGVREARACLELLAEMSQAIDRRPQINLLVSPEWLTVRAALLDVLRAHPEARTAVAARLVAIEGGRAAG
jgi:hypothetical protein